MSTKLSLEGLSARCENEPGFLSRCAIALGVPAGDVRKLVAEGRVGMFDLAEKLASMNRGTENTALKARVAELEAQLSKATPVGFWHTHPEHARRGEFSSNALRCADRADGWTEQTVTVTAQGVS